MRRVGPFSLVQSVQLLVIQEVSNALEPVYVFSEGFMEVKGERCMFK